MHEANARAPASLWFSYLAKVPDVEKVKRLEEIAFLHGKDVAACRQESSDVLQAQELQRKGTVEVRLETVKQSSSSFKICKILKYTLDLLAY